jgi:hypothetical protein
VQAEGAAKAEKKDRGIDEAELDEKERNIIMGDDDVVKQEADAAPHAKPDEARNDKVGAEDDGVDEMELEAAQAEPEKVAAHVTPEVGVEAHAAAQAAAEAVEHARARVGAEEAGPAAAAAVEEESPWGEDSACMGSMSIF